MTITAIERAANHINATELSDGRYAYYADETSSYHVVDADDLGELCDYLDDDDESISRDAYSHWCAGTTSEEMPAGWEPGEGTVSHITNEDIRTLSDEAAAAGDTEQVELCERALAGDDEAREACARAIESAQAMAD